MDAINPRLAGTAWCRRTFVHVRPYDADWPARHAEEAELLRHTLGGSPMAIEHVGSTAVPGLAAKPVDDAAVGRGTPVERVSGVAVARGLTTESLHATREP